jgi:hypothetical protein
VPGDTVNVWAGIIGNVLIGPWILPQRLNADIYLIFLRNSLPELLEELPLAVRVEMWFMHDGAPSHFSRNVRNFLNVTYPQRWIGRGCFCKRYTPYSCAVNQRWFACAPLC